MNRNPVLNSPDDITDNLIQQIISNDLDSLTINYEFTSKFDNSKDLEDYKKILFGELIISPLSNA